MGFEMIFIFLLALILFGPKKLPEMMREVGKFVAEFKRASNDFKYQLQNEIEKVETEATPGAGTQLGTQAGAQPAAQQTTSFTQTLLPPAVKSAISEIDSAHERLMRTARMAFDAQNFTLRPPEAPTAEPAKEEKPPAMAADSNAPGTDTGAIDASHDPSHRASHETFPVQAVTDQPTHGSAPANSDSARQSS